MTKQLQTMKTNEKHDNNKKQIKTITNNNKRSEKQ